MRYDGPAKLVIQIKSDWLLICFTFVPKSPGSFSHHFSIQNRIKDKFARQIGFSKHIINFYYCMTKWNTASRTRLILKSDWLFPGQYFQYSDRPPSSCQLSLFILHPRFCISRGCHIMNIIKLLSTECFVNTEKCSELSSSYGPHSVLSGSQSCGSNIFSTLTAQSLNKCSIWNIKWRPFASLSEHYGSTFTCGLSITEEKYGIQA